MTADFSCRRLCSGRAPFPAVGSVRVDPREQLGAQTLDLAQAPLHAPSSFGSPLVQYVEEPIADHGVDVDLGALRIAAAGLVFSECFGCIGSLDVGELLVCEVATKPGAASGCPAGARGGSGCAAARHIFKATASWADRASSCTCLVANSDQQTGQWRPARPARRRALKLPDRATRKSAC